MTVSHHHQPNHGPGGTATTIQGDAEKEVDRQMECLMKNNQQEQSFLPEKKEMTEEGMRGNTDTFFDCEDVERAPLKHSLGAIATTTTTNSQAQQQQLQRQEPFEETGRLLAEDIYSLFYTANPMTGAFVCSFLAIFGQIFLLVLILLDITDIGGDFPLMVPPGVPLLVNIAQFFGVIMTVWFLESNGDLMKGAERLTEGYDELILYVFPYATRNKWIAASSFQIIAGILMVIDLFILLMQSTTIIILCLNFAALHFVSDIPDVAFISASRGILTSTKVQKECVKIMETKTPPIKERYQKRIKRMRRIGMSINLALLYAGYFTLVAFQWNGHYMCSSLYVQFGDNYAPEMAYYSGRFDSQGSKPTQRIDSRTYFLDETKTIRLAYCHKEEAWTFSKIDDADNNDHCDDYIVKSIKTKTFDVTDLAGTSSWLSKHPVTDKDVPTDWLYLGCNECTTDTCEHGTCRSSSSSNNNDGGGADFCECDEGFMGRNCEFALPSCLHLDVNLRSQQVLAKSEGAEFLLETGESGFRLYHQQQQEQQQSASAVATSGASETTSSRMLQLRYFPLYLSIESSELTHNFALLGFVGRRWALFGRTGRDFFNTTEEYDRLIDLFQDRPEGDSILSFRDSWFVKQYRPYFFSEPVDLSSESFSLLPTGLNWYQAVEDPTTTNIVGWYADEGQLTGAKLQCADCDPETNPCQNGGRCEVVSTASLGGVGGGGEGKCVCPFSFSGTLCESAQTCNEIGGCMNNGTCNEYDYCECPHPFHGSLCQNYPTDYVPPFSCTREPCLNGGICNVILGTCDCRSRGGDQKQFTGKRCEEEVAN